METESGENADDSMANFDPIANSTANDSVLEDAPEDAPAEKKVKVSENLPEVYDIVPDSTEVKQVEPPKPPPEEESLPPQETSVIMDQKDLDHIISETLDIVDRGQKQANEQKLANQKMAFMLTKILGNLYDYEKFVDESLNTFLVNNEALQSDWYLKYCQQLPAYREYTDALRDSPDKITVDELPYPVSEADLKKLTTDVVNNLYAGGTHVKTQLTLCKNIKEAMAKRKKFFKEQMGPFSAWFILMNTQVDNQDTIRDKLFKVSAHVGFLKTGETSEPLTVDVNKSLKSLGAVRRPG